AVVRERAQREEAAVVRARSAVEDQDDRAIRIPERLGVQAGPRDLDRGERGILRDRPWNEVAGVARGEASREWNAQREHEEKEMFGWHDPNLERPRAPVARAHNPGRPARASRWAGTYGPA